MSNIIKGDTNFIKYYEEEKLLFRILMIRFLQLVIQKDKCRGLTHSTGTGIRTYKETGIGKGVETISV